MAQTKTRSKPKAKTQSKPKAKAQPKAKPKAAVETVEETAKDAGRAVGNAAGKAGHAVGKAKVPLMAGGAALAGVAGGLALGTRQGHRHRGIKGSLNRGIKGVDSEDLAKAVRKVGDFSAQIGELALEARRIREESNGKRNRSPIEVVLDGLTARRR